MSDPFGIPSNVFGDVPEQFYGALGRVVMLGALIEATLGQVVMVLDKLTEEGIAGQQSGKLLDRLRAIAKSRAGDGRPFSATFLALLDTTDSVMKTRNDVVHSIWPEPSMDRARGWRPVPRKLRSEGPGGHIRWTEASEEGLRSTVIEMVRIEKGLRDWINDPR